MNKRLHLFGKSILSTVFIISKIQEKPLHIFTAIANALFYCGMQLMFFAPSQKTNSIQSTCLQYGETNNGDKNSDNGVQKKTLQVFKLFIKKSGPRRDL